MSSEDPDPPDRRLRVESTDLYRLGGVTAGGWQEFERIGDLGFDARGNLYVFDRGASRIHVVTPYGRRIASFGGPGDGPGEFSLATYMSVAPDGTVAVRDRGRRSVAIFSPDHSYVGNVRLDESRGSVAGFRLDTRHRIVGPGRIIVTVRAESREPEVAVMTGEGRIANPPGVPILRMPTDGSGSEVLHWSWIPPVVTEDGHPVEVVFEPEIHWALLPDDRVAIADSLDYRIRIVGDGDVATIRRSFLPRAPTSSERREEIGRRAREASGRVPLTAVPGMPGRPAPGAARHSYPDLVFFDRLQVVRGLRADPSGRLWVSRLGSAVHAPGPVDVIASDGGYVGTLVGLGLPAALGPDGLAAWLDADVADVPIVVVRRIALGRPSGR